jgi:peptidoglycan/LPS O-acetylase OafA/YrhL
MSEIDKKYFPSLDGLRAISVLLVILVHLEYKSFIIAHIQGWLGVDFFFVISGFLITTLLLREEERAGHIDIFAFYARRFFRIVPVYAVVLVAYIALCMHDPEKWARLKHALPYYATFLNEFVTHQNRGTPYGTTWSLGIEEKFYLIWPLLFFVFFHRTRRAWVLPCLFATTALMPFWMGRSYFGLLVGCAIALAFGYEPIRGKLTGLMTRLPAGIAAVLIVVAFYLVDRNEKWVFFFIGVVALVIIHLLSVPSWLESMLSSHGFVWVGKRSYSMYLIHGLVLDAVQHFVTPVGVARQMGVLFGSFALCAVGADVLYRTVEEPARIIGKNILARHAHRKARPMSLGEAGSAFAHGTEASVAARTRPAAVSEKVVGSVAH